MSVVVDGYRHLIEPPVLGDCDDPDCTTYSALQLVRDRHEFRAGADVLLVAQYAPADRSGWLRVCSSCDERHLRAWLADDDVDGRP